MPELPEVETVIKTLDHLVNGLTIESVDVLRDKTIENSTIEFSCGVENAKITRFSRVGKYIIFHLSNNNVLISHLRMEGKYFLKDENALLTKHDLVVFHLNNYKKLIYNDTRRFGRIKLSNEETYLIEAPLNNVGPDPFMVKDEKEIFKKYVKSSLPIKSLLLDQSIMSGLGNIYVDEVLFDCMIHTLTKGKDITFKDTKRLILSSKKILAHAIELGGSTIKSYHPSEGVDGEFQINLKVYGHKDGKCIRCNHHLRKIFVNGRGTTYCPHCQKRVGAPFVIGVTGATASGKSTASKYLESKHCIYLSADEIISDLYHDKEMIEILRKKYPSLIIDNKVYKPSLREALVNDIKFKNRYEKFIHPYVFERMEKCINKCSSLDVVVIEVPLLFEAHFDDLCDITILLITSKKEQTKRIEKRGLDVIEALTLNMNFNETENKKKATYVIVNDNNLPSLYKKLDTIYDKVIHH